MNNQSNNISFNFYANLQFFKVAFETESAQRNRIMYIEHEGFSLEAYWKSANEQITGIHTLDYQKDLKNYQTSMINKALCLAILILLTSFATFAQAHFDFGGGAENIMRGTRDDNIPVMKISAGYKFHNIVAEGVIQPALTRQVNTPSYLGVKAGFDFHNLVPSVGYLYNYSNSDNPENNGWHVAYALKYQIPVNDKASLYIEGMYTKISYQLTAGFHVVFKNR